MVWEVITYCSDLRVSQDMYELNAGTWHTRLQFLALCLSRLGVLLVVYGFPAGPHAVSVASVCKKCMPGEPVKLNWVFPSMELSHSCNTNEGSGTPKHSQSQAVPPGLPPAFAGQSSSAAESCGTDFPPFFWVTEHQSSLKSGSTWDLGF